MRTNRRNGNGRDTREGALPLLPSGPGGVHVPASSRPQTCLLQTSAAAERVGFEPTIPFQIYTRSRRAPSAARPPLQRAESVGFEPTVPFPVRLISSQVPSTTRPALQRFSSNGPGHLARAPGGGTREASLGVAASTVDPGAGTTGTLATARRLYRQPRYSLWSMPSTCSLQGSKSAHHPPCPEPLRTWFSSWGRLVFSCAARSIASE